MQKPRQVGEPMHFRRPFHKRPRDRRQVGPQYWLGGVEVLIVLPGGDQDRAAGLLRVVEHAHRIAEPGRDVKIDHRELAGGLRVAVGHADHARFLQRQHIAQLVFDRERVHQRQFGGTGIAEQNLHAFLLEEFKKGAFSTHCGQGYFLQRQLRQAILANFRWGSLCRIRRASLNSPGIHIRLRCYSMEAVQSTGGQ